MSESPPSYLLCFDFDGTLIDPASEASIDPDFLAMLEAVQKRGAVWAINTGRSLYQAIGGIADHRVRPRPDYIIAKERELYEPSRFGRWVDCGDWNKKCHKDHHKLFRSYKKFFKTMRAHIEAHTGGEYIEAEHEPAGIVARDDGEMDRICEFIGTLAEKYPLLGYERNSIYLRFGHAAYSKGTVMAELAGRLGLPRERVFAAGDNHNDRSMLDGREAGMVTCPGNAINEIRSLVADAGGYVASGHGSVGLAEALRHFFPDLR
jgi:HAD superfamily hydrolase (TIGR01484 family)